MLVLATAGSRSVYKVEHGKMVLDRIAERPYPTAYGIIPQTHHIDAEPLDAFVLVTEPPLPCTLLPARPVGLIRCEGGGRLDDKILAVCLADPDFADIRDLADVPRRVLHELDVVLRTGWVTRIEWLGVERAQRTIEHAGELWRRSQTKI